MTAALEANQPAAIADAVRQAGAAQTALSAVILVFSRMQSDGELTALAAGRLGNFIIENVECEESYLPKGASKEIEQLIVQLASEKIADREKAAKALRAWTHRTATSKTVMRRILAGTTDAEVQIRLSELLR